MALTLAPPPRHRSFGACEHPEVATSETDFVPKMRPKARDAGFTFYHQGTLISTMLVEIFIFFFSKMM